ncbi:Exoglucanase/xylanase [Pseudolycoriella hygida]|uniref:endo-1,4-beta-xylanase n=1 Tax=Pseudolycoriella hygida TaxID=35572 RepID=A0A9Q0MUE4_9DIPT|nr:Exoglucanase/xylanase [Pseudolycoriella hygida]
MKIIFFLAVIGLCSAGLRDRASRKIGVALSHLHLGSSQYQYIAGTEFNSMTAEWQMKWDPIGNDPNTPNFAWAEELMSFAARHNQSVRGHTFIWHSAVPTWVQALENNAPALQAAISSFITSTATHFRGRCYEWDVVNEVIEGDGSYRNTIFYRTLGTTYIADAFRLARAADPYAKLFINDYNIEGVNAKSNALYNLVVSLLAQGVPIDGVGFQGHFIVGQLPTDFAANMQRFANLGLDVSITELDIRMNLPPTAANLQQQAVDYANAFRACYQVARCTGVTVWGVTDLYSWVPDFFPGQGAALLFDEQYATKPAYYSVESVLN